MEVHSRSQHVSHMRLSIYVMFHFYFIIFHFIVRIGIQIHMDRDYTYPLWDIYTGSDSALIYPTCEIYQGWDLCTNKISPQWRCIVEVSMYHTWDWVSMLLYKSIQRCIYVCWLPISPQGRCIDEVRMYHIGY